MKELQNIFGDIYLGGKKTKVSYDFFIVTNTRINQHMVASEYEGMVYKILSESPFNDKIVHIKISDDDLTNCTISDYLYKYFVMKTIDTLTYISCNQNKSPKILE